MLQPKVLEALFKMWFVEEESKRMIAKSLGIHRNTVTKYIAIFKENISKLEASDNIKIVPDNCHIFLDKIIKTSYSSINGDRDLITPEIRKKIEDYVRENSEVKLKKLWRDASTKVGYIVDEERCKNFAALSYDKCNKYDFYGYGYYSFYKIAIKYRPPKKKSSKVNKNTPPSPTPEEIAGNKALEELLRENGFILD